MTIQDAIDHLEELLKNATFSCEECRNEHEQLLSFLKQVPKHGKWIDDERYPTCPVCSVCGKHSIHFGFNFDKYCGSCGSIMDLKE